MCVHWPIVTAAHIILTCPNELDRCAPQTFRNRRRFEFDGTLRYVSRLPAPVVPAYTELDLRLGWQASDRLELSLVGQNLLHARHPEFGPPTPLREEVQRGAYGKVTWRF